MKETSLAQETISIRRARLEDTPVVVDFNIRLARESEGKILNAEVLSPGVQAALADEAKCRYFLAHAGTQPIGQLMLTFEWSDWRNGWIWWLQSVFVAEAYRGRGIFRALYDNVEKIAVQEGNVVGIRLYVEENNLSAHAVYKAVGLEQAGYFVMEKMLKSPASGGC